MVCVHLELWVSSLNMRVGDSIDSLVDESGVTAGRCTTAGIGVAAATVPFVFSGCCLLGCAFLIA